MNVFVALDKVPHYSEKYESFPPYFKDHFQVPLFLRGKGAETKISPYVGNQTKSILWVFLKIGRNTYSLIQLTLMINLFIIYL